MEAIFAVWQRDIIKFFRDRARLFGSFAMPLMFLLIFGVGMNGALSSMFSTSGMDQFTGFNYVSFIFPGIIAMTVFSTSIFSALSVVTDREEGYMKEILVSPVSRTYVAIGKIFGSATVAVIQGLLMLAFVPLIGVEVELMNIIKLIPAMLLVAFTLSSIGLLVASTLKTATGFQAVIQVLIFPMLFLSGAFFPLNGMPGWMNALVKVNPMTYAVDMFKHIMLDVGSMNEVLKQAMGLNLKLLGHSVSTLEEITFIACIGALFVMLATVFFNRSG
ncbi:MAG: ABC transporter permease [Candidatus Methanofastidiosa archaeon]|nr:ABC transporter permease [Candidatus Methanofastidiosa archaeon]